MKKSLIALSFFFVLSSQSLFGQWYDGYGYGGYNYGGFGTFSVSAKDLLFPLQLLTAAFGNEVSFGVGGDSRFYGENKLRPELTTGIRAGKFNFSIINGLGEGPVFRYKFHLGYQVYGKKDKPFKFRIGGACMNQDVGMFAGFRYEENRFSFNFITTQLIEKETKSLVPSFSINLMYNYSGIFKKKIRKQNKTNIIKK